MEAALGRISGVKPDEARTLARQESYAMNPARTAVVLAVADDLYRYDLGPRARCA
jgi:hypothetical protein